MKKQTKSLEYFLQATMVRETEKALLLSAECTDNSGHRSFRREVWFPKSVCQQVEDGSYHVAAWFARKTYTGNFSVQFCPSFIVK